LDGSLISGSTEFEIKWHTLKHIIVLWTKENFLLK
jgi:hypothetical protein